MLRQTTRRLMISQISCRRQQSRPGMRPIGTPGKPSKVTRFVKKKKDAITSFLQKHQYVEREKTGAWDLPFRYIKEVINYCVGILSQLRLQFDETIWKSDLMLYIFIDIVWQKHTHDPTPAQSQIKSNEEPLYYYFWVSLKLWRFCLITYHSDSRDKQRPVEGPGPPAKFTSRSSL